MKSLSLGSIAAWLHPTAHDAAPKARVLMIHGIGEHSARHLSTVKALNQAGYDVVRFDLRGAGQSGGPRQFINRFSDYVDDATTVHNWICRSLDPRPLYIFGHSMGGCVALHFTARYSASLAGLLLSAPARLPGDGISRLKIAVGRVVARFVPEMRIPKSTPGSALSRDPQVAEDYEKDPLSCQFNTLQQGSEVLKAMAEIPQILPAIQLPVFIAHGSHDRVVALEGSFEIIRGLTQERVLHVLPGGYHEPHNDLDRETYFALLTQWLGEQLSRKA